MGRPPPVPPPAGFVDPRPARAQRGATWRWGVAGAAGGGVILACIGCAVVALALLIARQDTGARPTATAYGRATSAPGLVAGAPTFAPRPTFAPYPTFTPWPTSPPPATPTPWPTLPPTNTPTPWPTATPTPTPRPAATSTPAPTSTPNVYVVDAFGSSASGFPRAAEPDAAAQGYRAGYGDGYYAIRVPPSGSTASANAYNATLAGQSYQDFALDIRVHWAQPVGQGAYGIVFRAGDKGRYDVAVAATGAVRITKVVEGRRTIIRDWAWNYAYRGGTQENALAVSCQGPNISVWLNGSFVASFVDTDLRFGEVGLLAVAWEIPVEAQFTYLRVAPPR